MNTMQLRRKTAAVAVAASLALLPMDGVATAHRSNDPSTISIRAMKQKFQGRVKSPKRRCLKNRDVTVYRQRPGRDRVVGSTKTVAGGHWTLRKKPKKDKTYYARVKRKVKKRHGHVHRCKAARSRNVKR